MIRRPPRSTLFPYNDALPILSCGCRSRTDFATTASTTVTDGVAAAGAGGGGGGGGAGLGVACAAGPPARRRADAPRIFIPFFTALPPKVSLFPDAPRAVSPTA